MPIKLRQYNHRYQRPLFELPFTMKVQKADFQNQEDGPQRKRVAQRTFCVREHTQAFDGEHIRCRLSYVSLLIVIKARFLNYL